ncbi:lipoprotein LipL41 [Leptospira interrogans]|uniref:Major outer membrane protein n=1 Tax=Leptospira weilii serovar Manhao II TaxID=280503 RepID=Q6GXB6_9LEPT|nr:lipoprotein LipL41 [Leptospira interrogans]AAT48505.1 major outer membrane protein [Leptospira weilii serovar Manhao II]
MRKLSSLISVLILLMFLGNCAATVDVEYPVFPKDKEGRALQKFLGTIRNVGLAVEAPKKSLWEAIFGEGSSFIDQMPSKVFEAFDKESYYKLTDLSKRADAINEASLSLTGITKNRAKIGNLIGAEAILYIGYQKPYTECSTENKIDAVAAGLKVAGFAASMATGKDVNTGNEPVSKPTGVRMMLIPLDATLIKVETGEVKKAVVSSPAKIFNSVGNLECPSILDSFGQGLDEAAAYIKGRLSPIVKTERIKVFVKDEDEEVKELLQEGYEEIVGETPSFKKAKEAWEKADKKAKGQSWGAKANLATYYFSTGDFEKSIKLYEEAMKLKDADKSYLRELRKRVEATFAVDESNAK